MKTKCFICILFILVSINLSSQDKRNMITVNGGYAFTKIDREQTYSTTTALKTQGFRTDVLYEFIPEGQPVAYGFLVGYAGLYANESFSSYPNQKAEYRI